MTNLYKLAIFGRLQEEASLLDNKMNQAKGSLAAAYAALNRAYEDQQKGAFTRSNTLSEVTHTLADTSSAGGTEIQKFVPGSNRSTDSDAGEYGGNGMGKFLNTEDIEKLNMIAAAQKVAAYHVQQSNLLTVVCILR